MNAAKQHLEVLIEDRQSKVFELQRNIRQLEAEINAFKIAIQALGEFSPNFQSRLFSETNLPALSDTWARVLAFIGEREGKGASIDEIESFIASASLDIKRNNVRSQVSNYFHKGILRRVAPSRYELAEAGYLAVSSALKANRLPSLPDSIAQLYRINSKQTAKPQVNAFAGLAVDSSLLAPEMSRENQSHKHGRPYDDDDGFNRD